MSSTKLTLDDVLDRLRKVKRINHSRAQACCPAHADKSPSMTVTEGKTCILLHCFAGCSFDDIVRAMGIDKEQLLYAEVEGGSGRMWQKPQWAKDADALRQLNLEEGGA